MTEGVDGEAVVVRHSGPLDGASLRATLLDLEQREPAPVLVLQGATVTGTVDLSFIEFRSALRFVDCTFTGGVVRLEGSGMLDVRFSGCEFGEGFAANGVRTVGDLLLKDCRFGTTLSLRGARIGGKLVLTNSTLSGDPALEAEYVAVGGSLLARGSFTCAGDVQLNSAEIAGNLDMSGGQLSGSELRLDSAHVRGAIFLRDGFLAEGHVLLAGCDASDLEMWLAEVRGQPVAIEASGVQLSHNMRLRDLTTRGSLRLLRTQIGGHLTLDGAQIGGEVRADHVQIGTDLHCTPSDNGRVPTIGGTFRAHGARIGCTLSFEGAYLHGPETALSLDRASVAHNFVPPEHADGVISLVGARLGTIHATSLAPYRMRLEHTQFQQLLPVPDDLADRLSWLERQLPGFSPGPYTQLAGVYRARGDSRRAHDVLIARESRRPRTSRIARAWSVVMRLAVGYGYRPQRALGWLAALLLLGTLAISVLSGTSPLTGHDVPAVTASGTAQRGEVPPRTLGAYAVDGDQAASFVPALRAASLLVPFPVASDRWYPRTSAALWSEAGIRVLGWILAAAVLAGVARTFNRTE